MEEKYDEYGSGNELSEDMFGSMPDAFIDRPAQIPLRRSRLKHLVDSCPMVVDRWVIYHHSNHFILYDKASKYCIYDAEYICHKDSGEPDAIVAVISRIRINQDAAQYPRDIGDDFDTVADIILKEGDRS